MEQGLLSKLNDIIESIPFIFSEVWIAVLLIFILIADLFVGKIEKKVLYIIAVIGVIFDIVYLSLFTEAAQIKLMLFALVQDSWSIKLRILEDVGVLLLYIQLYINTGFQPKTRTKLSGESEWIILSLGILLGAHVMTMANDFIVAILALELMSLPSYLLTAFKGDKKSIEAAVRYFLFGAVATSITIYGVSILYGLSTAVDLQGIAEGTTHSSLLFTVGIILTMMGLLFKLGGFPMHIWVPDVYQSAPIEAVAFFSTVPKVGATVFLYRFFYELDLIQQDFLPYFILVIATVSMFVGNLAALYQKSLRRLMGYSSIANAGFFIVAILNKGEIAMNALFYFLWVYVIANFAIFYFIGELERVKSSDNLEDLEGIGWSSNAKIWGPAIVLVVVSLIGLPPLAGFMGKLLIFTSLWELYNQNKDFIYLVALFLGLLNTAISLVYYMKIPYFMYKRNHKVEMDINPTLSRIIIILGLFLLITFLIPSILL